MSDAAAVRALFGERFGGDPLVVRSPGRVNLIGEHTDYNEGFVLPAAIDRGITLAVGGNGGLRCRLLAADLGETFERDIDDLAPSDRGWPNYLLGVADQLRRRGIDIPGFDCVFGGDVPIGAGMSSSAAIGAGLAFALNELFDLGLDRLTLAQLAQAAEHQFAGVHCGIMDQFVNLFGQPGHALKLDCRSLAWEPVPFAYPDVRLVVCDTGVRHALAGTEYNVRRQQCDAGVALLRLLNPGVRSLRDVDRELLERGRERLDPVAYRRCRHVIEENERLLAGCTHLSHGDLDAFGACMYASHASLRDDYEVSCPELDAFVEIASGVAGVVGSRMMGGGFGGCTINLVRADAVDRLADAIGQHTGGRAARDGRVLVTAIAGGTAVVE